MKIFRQFASKSGEAKDLLKFLWKVKMWFLIPFIVLLVIFAALMIFAQSTGIAPFIYSLI